MTAIANSFGDTSLRSFSKGYLLNVSDHLLFGDLHRRTIAKVLETHSDLEYMRFRIWSSKFQLYDTLPDGKTRSCPEGAIEVDVPVDYTLCKKDGEISDLSPMVLNITICLLSILKNHCYVH